MEVVIITATFLAIFLEVRKRRASENASQTQTYNDRNQKRFRHQFPFAIKMEIWVIGDSFCLQ